MRNDVAGRSASRNVAQPFGECEQPGEPRDRERHADRRRAHILDPADVGMQRRGYMIGELLDRRIEQLDRHQQQDDADQREPFPGGRRDDEGERQRDRERYQLFAVCLLGFRRRDQSAP
jgi:hypothetical protein